MRALIVTPQDQREGNREDIFSEISLAPRGKRSGVDTMNAIKLIMTLGLLAGVVSATTLKPTPSLAQSQPNYGPNSPGGGDTYGEPYSGSAAARRKSGGW
jgi:hypothetical protein